MGKYQLIFMKNLQKFYKNKKVLITGHTGFKGGWLSQILLDWGATIIGISLKPNTNPSLFKVLGLEKNVKNYFCDIRNFKKVLEIFKKEQPEIVFHLAAQPLVRESYSNPLYTFETNIIGTANVLQAMREIETVRAAVMITTDKVYENKESGSAFKESDKLGGYDPYSASKAAAEIVIDSYIKSFFNPRDYNKKHKTLIASARAGNVIGGGDWCKDRIVTDIVRAIFEKDEKIIIRNPDAIRPWLYVLEPLYGYLLLAEKLYSGKKEFVGSWNFGPNNKNYLTVEKLVKMTLELLRQGTYKIQKDPTMHEARLLKINSHKTQKFLNWQAKLGIETILKLTCDWYQAFYNKKDVVGLTNQQINNFFKE